ncbi:MAG TPA: oligopeptide transporter, OPT family [Tepidisphaeraceae bacterium]|jgi:putative OPT family oligopeptide transporter|nr:oligopeptide transporter, OPT family [Tepidisphaeraceae bacterium]
MTAIQHAKIDDAGDAPPEHHAYIESDADIPEFTWSAVLLGAILGIIFGASSLYLVLKVGLTVSASIPVAVLSITLFRVISKVTGLRRATILENNIVQTTGSAGESIAFGVGVTMPALMLLGFDMDAVRVMTVGVLGGLLGVLMMIPLRRAFIVKQHRLLVYPEGTACADVLIVGEQGGSTARTVFTGFGLAFVYKVLTDRFNLWKGALNLPLFSAGGKGLPGAVLGTEVAPELVGVGYIIGPRIASLMLAGGVLAYLVIVPTIVIFSKNQSAPIAPATRLVRDLEISQIRGAYVLYIGAGAVAAGGVISMFQALPLIFSSAAAGWRDLRSKKQTATSQPAVRRIDQDLPMSTVLFGTIGLIAALAAAPRLGLGLSVEGVAGAALIVFFGFLFVTVSSRLTGEIGSSSNPISGMTVATLLFTCLVFLLLGRTNKAATLTAMTVAAVVCVASSNGGTTAQDLKTGYLVGATPRRQQYAILIGALTSALVIGGTLLLLNRAGTVYTTRAPYVPTYRVADIGKYPQMERAGGEYAGKDLNVYHVVHARAEEFSGVQQGKYLVDGEGRIKYLVDPAINGRVTRRDDGAPVANKFEAPKAQLMALIVDGILNRKLPWGLVLLGVLIAVTVELMGMPSLPFAVGVYLPIQTSAPIFLGGAIRWLVTRMKPRSAESEMSSGSLLATGYIAGGTIGGVVVAFTEFLPDAWTSAMKIGERHALTQYTWPAVIMFGALLIVLILVSIREQKSTIDAATEIPTPRKV